MYENTTALNVSLVSNPMPGCGKYEFRSDDYFRCCIRTMSISLFHHCGTNSMGKVVDSNLRFIIQKSNATDLWSMSSVIRQKVTMILYKSWDI